MKKHILVVDDSAVVRRYLVKLFKEAGYEVQSAKNGMEALDKLHQKSFSLVVLDFDMPLKDGLETLQELMECCAARVLMLNTYADDSADTTFEALECGALDYIYKPPNAIDIVTISDEILEKTKQLLLTPLSKVKKRSTLPVQQRQVKDSSVDMGFVLIGASTGGPRLIEKICKSLPANYPHAVCVVQHMPTDFTANFAKRLNSLSAVEVVEADNEISLQKGRVIIAKGGWHLHFRKKLNEYKVKLVPNTAQRFFVPAVDEMFLSACSVLPTKKILAIELTGIGDDGADGMVELRKAGAFTIAESEKTAIVYGMPKEAYERGGAQKVLDFDDIVNEIIVYGQQ